LIVDELYGPEPMVATLCVSVLAGGGAAWLAGRAIADTWRPLWHVIGYMLVLGAAVRFVHFALFQAPLASVPGYLADTALVTAIACLAWQTTRVRRMVTQYPWLYRRASPLTWREQGADAADARVDL
jgi:hypothetical protein